MREFKLPVIALIFAATLAAQSFQQDDSAKVNSGMAFRNLDRVRAIATDHQLAAKMFRKATVHPSLPVGTTTAEPPRTCAIPLLNVTPRENVDRAMPIVEPRNAGAMEYVSGAPPCETASSSAPLSGMKPIPRKR